MMKETEEESSSSVVTLEEIGADDDISAIPEISDIDSNDNE